ncbi:hypothetical protein [Alteromonas sp. H39]|uniref:hypothetical protein n=1 Tax=Alteromonas sp. H39 TaxID=3389876 RepID=UPI0039DFC003
MDSAITKKRVVMLTLLPILGVIVSLMLRWLAGPTYTTSLNQSEMYVFFKGATIWSVVAFSAGIFLYTRCSEMNHSRFAFGAASVLLGASLPWLIGPQ